MASSHHTADARKRGTNRPFSALLCFVWLGVLAPAQSAAPALLWLRRRYFVAHQPPGPANPHAGFPRRVLGERRASHCEQFAGERTTGRAAGAARGPPSISFGGPYPSPDPGLAPHPNACARVRATPTPGPFFRPFSAASSPDCAHFDDLGRSDPPLSHRSRITPLSLLHAASPPAGPESLPARVIMA
ncbi:hypothetical protein TgHK011_008058 [Trichoderma gracile]|nr:hypothetical protein TgHK011_008058 [Trichoderma gracile]